MKSARSYRSPLREERAGATTDALLRAMAHQLAVPGAGEVSVPQAAAAAGVAVRTAYHHFPEPRTRLAAVAAWADAALGPLPPIAGAADLPAHCRRSLARAERDLPLARALSVAARAEDAGARRQRTRHLEIAALLTGIGAPPPPTTRATATVAMLAAPETLVPLVDGHGLSPAEAVEAAAEAVTAVLVALRAQRRPSG